MSNGLLNHRQVWVRIPPDPIRKLIGIIMKIFVLKEDSEYTDEEYIVDTFLADDDFEINLTELSRKWKRSTWKRGTWHNKYGHGKCKNRKPTIPFYDWMIDYLKLESVEWMEGVM